MNEEVISISSSESNKRNFIQFYYPDKKKKTDSSESAFVERVPVSWPKVANKLFFDVQENQTPTVVQKVCSWMTKSLENDSKSPSTAKYFNLFEQIQPVKSVHRTYVGDSVKVSDGKSETSSEVYEVPLSPESQKKELYQYLKLMNPADKKEILLIQNRRSNRVKNLMLQEKREMEKKLKVNGDFDDSLTMKSCKDLNMKYEVESDKIEELFQFPYPPMDKIKEVVNFESTVKSLINGIRRKNSRDKPEIKRKLRRILKIREKERLKKFSKKKLLNRHLQNKNKVKMLRSTGKLQNVGIKKLLWEKKKKKKEKSSVKENQTSVETMETIDDLDFNSMSEEHRRCMIESQLMARPKSATPFSSRCSNNDPTPFLGFTGQEIIAGPSKIIEEKKEEITNGIIEKAVTPVTVQENGISGENEEINENGVLPDHDYAYSESSSSDSNDDDVIIARSIPKMSLELVTPQRITGVEYEPFSRLTETKSLHRSLLYPKRKSQMNGCNASPSSWDSDLQDSKKTKNSNQSHSICISQDNGDVLNAFYIDCNLVVSQEYVVSFWTQSALGNVLGANNMWIPKGHTSRIVLNNKCIQKKSMEMIFSIEGTLAYVELWTKEHKSEIRQGPVADVFATVYFWKQRQTGLEKKVLQIENINGFADDVQYVVLKNSSTIIVSWHSVSENSKITCVHKYSLAPDFATTVNTEIEPVDHYVSSLHNIEDCDLIMGCGENKITLWNIEHGYIVSTIELNDIKTPLSTLWVKCDRGFLFTLQQCVDRELRLIAINGINHSWKRLQSYIPPEGYDTLKGVCIEHGNLVSFYDKGILCWNAQTAEPVVEDSSIDPNYIPSGSYVILVENGQITVRHALSHLLTLDDS